MSKNVNVDAIWVLSALDKFMNDSKNDPTFFCKLFQKKQIIINALRQGKIDAKKYKSIVGKALKDQNAVVKECATSDTLKLKDPKNQELVNSWFKDLIESTGSFYENQEKNYQKFQSAIKPKQEQIKQVSAIKTNQIKIQPKKQQPPPPKAPSPPKATQSSNITGVNLQQVVSFKVIDSLLEKYQQKKQFYQTFIQKKRQLLDQVNNKTLTAQKYKSVVSAYQSKTKNEDFKSDMKFQLDGITDFHDGNTQQWFKELVQQTKDSMKEQEQHLADLLKGKSSVKKQSQRISLQISAQRSSKLKESGPIDLKEVVNFKAIQQYLQNQQENKVNYKLLLQKKKNLLDLHKKGGLTAQKYKDLLVKAKSSVKNAQLKESIQMELQQIQDLHDGNVKLWYKDVIESAQLFLQDQEKKLNDMQKGIQKKKEEQVQDDDSQLPIQEKPASMQKIPSQNANKSKANLNSNQLCSLKAIDQYLTQNEKNPEVFCKYFQRKLQIFQMMKNGELTPQKYKQIQEKTVKTTTDQKLKNIVEMDLQDLQDIDGDVNKWFQELVNDSGFNYEDQEQIYNKFKKNKGSTGQKQPQSNIVEEKQHSYLIKIIEKPVINDVICFTAIYKLFVYAVERVDLIYYKQLQLKRTKLIDLVSQNKLTPSKYRDINKAAAGKTQNAFLKSTIIEEEGRLKSQFKGNEQSWYESLVGVLKSPPPELKLPENKEMKQINSGPIPKKIQYFLRQMAIYQCLFYFYKKVKIPISQNRYLDEYQRKKRKQVVNCLQIIQQDSKFDVFNLTSQLFPPINNDVFYGDNLPALKKRAQSYIPLIAKEIAALKDYVSKIKKSTNAQNIQTVKKQIAKCEENIAFLKSWPSGGMIPFPTITEQKVEKYNLDLNSKLDKNDMEIFITSVSGLPSQSLMSIYLVNTDKQRYSNMVSNGPLNVRFVAKLSEKEMFQICKGDKKHLLIRFFKKGFFGGLSLISQGQNINYVFKKQCD